MLKVTVAEMDRQVIKQLGINLSGSFGYGSAVVNFNTNNPFPINGTPSSSISGGFKGLTADVAGDGASRRGPHTGRADPHRDLW